MVDLLKQSCCVDVDSVSDTSKHVQGKVNPIPKLKGQYIKSYKIYVDNLK